MADDNKREEAALALKQIFPSADEFDMSAYRAVGGAEGVERLQAIVASAPADEVQPPADDAPTIPYFTPTGPRSGRLDAAAYLAQRARLFAEDDVRRSKK